jgi:8-oxo-dGTP pyrophosphatase MutT (NUDIX family)
MHEMTEADTDRTAKAPLPRDQITPSRGPKRPRDAATLILLDRAGDDFLVLMGKRHASHVFMPGKLVFPGGRTDPDDSRIAVSGGLRPEDEAKLKAGPGRTGSARARALALSAIRETYEEAGLLIGRNAAFTSRYEAWQGFVQHGVEPSLQAMRLIARAITPPGNIRRFDTRFFAAWRKDVAVELPCGPSTELEELKWLPLSEAKAADIPAITLLILDELEKRLQEDPFLLSGAPIPFYRSLNGRHIRQLL